MPAFLDIAAKDFKSQSKGDILTISGVACSEDPSGRMVGIEITDTTVTKALHYVYDWKVDFSHTLVNQNAQGWRFRVEVDPAYISMSEVGKGELKSGMQDHVETSEYWEGSQVVSFTSDSMTVDIPKNGVYQTASGLSDIDYLKLLKSDFSDIFKVRLKASRYHVSESDVDIIIIAGGFMQITEEQALNQILDKLDE